MKIRLLDASEVGRVFADGDRVAEWERLHRACPWATPYQAPAFARAWYEVYASVFSPLIVEGRSANGALVGLLALARQGEQVVAVGAHHAEYQGWIAEPGSSEFIVAALVICGRELGCDRLTLRHLPKGTPLDWARRTPAGIHVAVRAVSRGLMAVDAWASVTSLREPSNGSRLQRLARRRPVRLRRLTTRAELEAVIDDIATQCDLREAAVHGGTPFRDDPRKRELYLRLMDEPGLLHTVVLKAGDTVTAAHAGISDGGSVSLGLMTHRPFEATCPPGTLLPLLARRLRDDGYRVFDLTPSGDTSTHRFATHVDEVHTATVFFRRRAFAAHAAARLVARAGRGALAVAGVDRSRLESRLAHVRRRLRSPGPARALRSAVQGRCLRWWALHEFRMYRIVAAAVPRTEAGQELRRDALEDLLLYQPASTEDASRQEFLARAIGRLEAGQHVYTRAAGGVLLHYAWVDEYTERAGSDFGHEFRFPGPAAVLWDDYTRPEARGHGLQTRSILRRLQDAAAAGHTSMLIGVRAENAVSRHNIEKVGFRHWASGWAEYRFGRARRFITYAEAEALPLEIEYR